MNTIKILSIVLITVFFISCGDSQTSSENAINTKLEHAMVKVWGNCGMCKKTIEASIADMEGLSVGKWDVDKKVLHVEFDSTKTSLDKISLAVAGSGYDTEFHTAADDAYNGLHSCCQYDRK